VKAPISGRVGRAEIKVGNLVGAGPSAPLLTSIVSTDGVYADFEVDEQTYLKYIRGTARDLAEESMVPVKLSLGGDTKEYRGTIQSFDNRIDSTSGTIRARALFDNEDGALLPGMFASIKMGSPSEQTKIMIDERAIGTDQNRKFVYVVNDQNMVEYRAVDIGESIEGMRVINSGLNDGDKVITDGIIKIRPGMPVTPQVAENQTEAASPLDEDPPEAKEDAKTSEVFMEPEASKLLITNEE
jgi:multidrug efflux system membrane fusion protein